MNTETIQLFLLPPTIAAAHILLVLLTVAIWLLLRFLLRRETPAFLLAVLIGSGIWVGSLCRMLPGCGPNWWWPL